MMEARIKPLNLLIQLANRDFTAAQFIRNLLHFLTFSLNRQWFEHFSLLSSVDERNTSLFRQGYCKVTDGNPCKLAQKSHSAHSDPYSSKVLILKALQNLPRYIGIGSRSASIADLTIRVLKTQIDQNLMLLSVGSLPEPSTKQFSQAVSILVGNGHQVFAILISPIVSAIDSGHHQDNNLNLDEKSARQSSPDANRITDNASQIVLCGWLPVCKGFVLLRRGR